ncbi:hypothetical protein ACHAXN_004591 [Cyclotella atomus]
MTSYNNLLDGVTLPAKDEVAAAIAAVRSRGRGGTPLNSPGGMSTPGGRFGTTFLIPPPTAKSAGAPATTSSSLFQQSSAKLQSFSFGESTEESIHVNNNLPSSSAATPSNRYTLSPTMAQLRARKIINDSKNLHHMHNNNHHYNTNSNAVNKPLSPTFSDDDTDIYTVVDPSTLAQVGQFIDSLQKKKLTSPTSNNNSSSSNVNSNGNVNSSNNVKSSMPLPSPASARYSSLNHAKAVMKQQLKVVTKIDNVGDSDGGSDAVWSPSGTTPKTGNITSSNGDMIAAAVAAVPYLPESDDDTSISIESSIECMPDHEEILEDCERMEGVDKKYEEVKPETEEELDTFIQSMNTTTIMGDGPGLNVSTIADELNAMSVLEDRSGGVGLYVDSAGNALANATGSEQNESESASATDKAVAAPTKFSLYTSGASFSARPLVEAAAEKKDDSAVSADNASTSAAENQQQKQSGSTSAADKDVAAPTIFSFYNPQSFVPTMDKPMNSKREPAAATLVESKLPVVEKLKTATTPSALENKKVTTPSSFIHNKQPATTPTARARMFLASSTSKPKTLVSRIPQSPASSLHTTKEALTPKDKSAAIVNETPSNKEDPTYEESLSRITTQIQEVVRSQVPSMTLGKVLAEANRRGITLDVVTEIYKKERFKLSSEKIAKWEAEAGVANKNKGLSEESVLGVRSKQQHDVVQDGSTADLQERKVPLTPEMQSPEESEMVTPVEIEQPAARIGVMPSTPVESHAQAEQIKPVTMPSTPVESHAQVEHIKPVAMPSTPVESHAQSEQIKPVKIPDSKSVKATTALTIVTKEIPSTPKSPAIKPSAIERILSPRSALDHFVVRIKESVRSDNPSQELGNILADAKKHHIPVNPLVELYTKERMALPFVPRDISVSEDVGLAQSNTEVSEVSDAVPDSDSFEDGERGLSDTQLQQLQQLISRSGEMEDADDRLIDDIDDDVEKAAVQHLEDIDAFFSRFAIDGVDAESDKKTAVTESNGTSDSLAAKDSNIRRKTATVRFQTPSQEVFEDDFAELEPQDSSQFSERGNIAEVTTTNGKETVLYMQESSLEVEFVEPIVQATAPKKKKKKVKEKKQKVIKIRPRDNRRVVVLRDDLPGYLAYWRSPWEADRVRSHYYSTNSKNDEIDGVAAAARFARRSGNPRQRHCFLSEKERTKDHKGYREIDFYSLYEATTVQAEDQEIDLAPWDCRDVRQRFLHEKSVESRNWFGTFVMSRGNDRMHYPVSRPKSLQMQVTRIPDEDEWNENWYTTWRSRRDNPNNLIAFAELEIKTPSYSEENNTIVEGLSSIDESIHTSSSKAPKRKVTIEIGTLCPVRLKTGERISRVHPEFTSSLRRSRWRKKYVSGMKFPGN